MVRPACDIEEELLCGEHARYKRDVGKVRSTLIRVVESDHVTRTDVPILDRRPHRKWHRTQVNRHVIALCDHVPTVVEDSARVIPPLLDIRREGRALQGCPHFLRDGVEEALKNFELDWIGFHRFRRVTGAAVGSLE